MSDLPLFDAVHGWTYSPAPRDLTVREKRDWERSQLDMRIAMRQAKRFILDDAFVRAVVHTANVSPVKMLNLCHLANLPFDKLWVEFNANPRADAQEECGTSGGRNGEELGWAGLLMERRDPAKASVFRIACIGSPPPRDDGTERLPLGAVSYILDVEGDLPLHAVDHKQFDSYDEEAHRTMRFYEDNLRAVSWGYQMAGFKNRETGELIDAPPVKHEMRFACTEALARRAGVMLEQRFFSPMVNRTKSLTNSSDELRHIQEAFHKDIIEDRGNLRFIVAMLAMINCVPITYREREARGYFRHRLRNVPYMQSTQLTIVTGRRRIIEVVKHAIRDAISQRHNKRHEVRGHWALAEYGKGGRACPHEPVERDGDYAMCGKCSRLIHWRDHYERGDASLGYVDHSYRVKT